MFVETKVINRRINESCSPDRCTFWSHGHVPQSLLAESFKRGQTARILFRFTEDASSPSITAHMWRWAAPPTAGASAGGRGPGDPEHLSVWSDHAGVGCRLALAYCCSFCEKKKKTTQRKSKIIGNPSLLLLLLHMFPPSSLKISLLFWESTRSRVWPLGMVSDEAVRCKPWESKYYGVHSDSSQ